MSAWLSVGNDGVWSRTTNYPIEGLTNEVGGDSREMNSRGVVQCKSSGRKDCKTDIAGLLVTLVCFTSSLRLLAVRGSDDKRSGTRETPVSLTGHLLQVYSQLVLKDRLWCSLEPLWTACAPALATTAGWTAIAPSTCRASADLRLPSA
ncbi:hypothetical protein SODALDRAFT_194470 [Sodiomyces alkalinus F11]|uniref:Uncharacterized protein n=1 Tax=Sodiomyces alkalinus (strain CBS 110278 / VKM F-3762 / F11) TaxID=1314773 RepID=A0A3N2PS64_SODAK|nr:hypothetical protein SODALDRAFT_194470 [Sodiomyces alkalinus F11]ROT37335.1 hypothetical protein SODALDRAFT_194470 [Sodiomyces alkalinus F11]